MLRKLVLALLLAAATVLLGSTPSHAAAALTVTPSTALPNQAVSLQGTGLTTGSGVTIASVTLEGVIIPSGKINNGNTVHVDSAGKFVAIVMVPISGATLTPGGKTIAVTDSRGGAASVALTIPTPALALSTASSRVGTTVDVTGSNFHTNSSRSGSDYAPAVHLYYVNNGGASSKQVGTAVPDAAGGFKATITVPFDAAVGLTNKVKAVTVGGPIDGFTADHAVPAPLVTVTPAAGAPESQITLKGENLPAFTQVKELSFAHVSQVPATPVFTDAAGQISLVLKVPLLEDGTYPVTVQVGSTSYVVPYTLQGSWYTPPPTPTPAPKFTDTVEGLTPLGPNLVRAWNLDNATKTWAFYDPDPALAGVGKLSRLVERLVYWVRLKEDQTAVLNGQERTLFAGWNLIPW